MEKRSPLQRISIRIADAESVQTYSDSHAGNTVTSFSLDFANLGRKSDGISWVRIYTCFYLTYYRYKSMKRKNYKLSTFVNITVERLSIWLVR